MNEITNYVERIFSKVPDSKKKYDIMQEITESMLQSAKRHMDAGVKRVDAINRAIVEFGELGEIVDELKESFDSKQKKGASLLLFSIIGALIVIALVLFINLYYSPSVIWWIYPTFGIIWWPLSVFFFANWRKKK